MEKRTETALASLKKEITLLASNLERQDAAEFFNELADWSYANGEAMLIDDDPGFDEEFETEE